MSDADAQKRAAGEAAAALVQSGMTVGMGTGSTAAWFVRALAARRLEVTGVATSEATAALAGGLGLKLADLDDVARIDLTVDGADEIGPGLGLIKGAGGALLREKLVWIASDRCVVIADASKTVARLGAVFPLPVEVVPFGHRLIAEAIGGVLGGCEITAKPILRCAGETPFRTDNGNLIYDVSCDAIDRPNEAAAALKGIVGVVEHGLFLGLAERALIAGVSGVETLWP